MSVKLIVIQLELNDIVYKLVFHNYLKFCIKHMIHINIRKETKIMFFIVFKKQKNEKSKNAQFFSYYLKTKKRETKQ